MLRSCIYPSHCSERTVLAVYQSKYFQMRSIIVHGRKGPPRDLTTLQGWHEERIKVKRRKSTRLVITATRLVIALVFCLEANV